MIIKTKEKDVHHPEGKILLKNGNVLDCFLKADQSVVISRDEVVLDTTGEFLQVKGVPKKLPHKSGLEPWKEFFYKEAFFLYEHREQIMADSRMFLTPLPYENNLAYTGTSGLRDATLGVYLEWWEECEHAVIKKDGEVQALTYFIAGSPLSGLNRCSAVNKNGKCRTIVFSSPFSELWSTFMCINQRYTEAKQIYQSYTLEETISQLRKA